ncbi:bifunctional transcriptional activator/DNA repair enzyme AdaA [Brevibacillus borstelensis]|uniref:bifunctional transcriptional activator/DNA repair enzyme AdaA n=1 Tax=Brevibacillus borstelensis TaxID=45462 RepID=UPI0030C5B3E3
MAEPSDTMSHDGIIDSSQQLLTDEKWQAIIHNDASYDNQFFYAVKTTSIFCRPSCKSRPPNKQNVRIFQNAQQALKANFRPCKRCKPTGQRLPDSEWVAQITNVIDNHFSEQMTLETLAEMCHGSPYHLHRTFKRIKGITPGDYVQQLRMDKAKKLLAETDKTVTDIAFAVGMSSTSYFVTLFRKATGQTPTEYRQRRQTGIDQGGISR